MFNSEDIYITKPFLPPMEDLTEGLKNIWDSRILSNQGPNNIELESQLCDYLGVPYVSLFSNCTIALMAGIRALELKGEVITTPFSFPATVSSIVWNNLYPSFVDIDSEYFNLNTDLIENKINDKTSAILAVHAYGYSNSMDNISRIANKYNLKVIYDGAASFGSFFKDKSLLSYGDLSVVSFHATKIFHTFEGGAIISHDLDLKKKIDSIRNFGFNKENNIENVGLNGKMSEFNSLLGLSQLKYFRKVLSTRKLINSQYNELLNSFKYLRIPKILSEKSYNNTYYPVMLKENSPISRDCLVEKLREKRIYVKKYYSPLLNNHDIYGNYDSNSLFPVANDVAKRIICLPIYPDLDNHKQLFIINQLKLAFS